MEDPSETFAETDWLARLIGTLKDGEVAHFRYGELELSFDHEESQMKGFVPKEQTAGEQAKEPQARTPYHKAFGGAPPGFTRPKLPEMPDPEPKD